MALTKPPVLPAWAEAGDKVQPSNAEIQAGWPLSNVPPSRQRFNWLLNFLANGIRYLTRRGMPDYGADETYMIGDRVIGDDGKTYRSLQDNNTGNAPSASPLWWEEWAPSLSRLADLLQKQTYTGFTTGGAAPNFTLTPNPAITAYSPGQRFRVKFHAAGSGADALNVSGLGNKNLKQYDSTGAKVAAVIAANQLADVEYDGVDIVVLDPLPVSVSSGVTPPQFDNDTSLATTEFVKRAMGGLRGIVGKAAAGALAAADVGMLVEVNAAVALTLPAANTVPAGEGFLLHSTIAGASVARAGADVIYTGVGANSVTSLTINRGEHLMLVSNGATGWYIADGSTALAFADVFGASLGAPGYQKLPSGLIVQWGSGDAGSGGPTITFPIAFPNACRVVICGDIGTSPTVQSAFSITNTNFRWYAAGASDASNWIAIGN